MTACLHSIQELLDRNEYLPYILIGGLFIIGSVAIGIFVAL